jgi:hypothetical protein
MLDSYRAPLSKRPQQPSSHHPSAPLMTTRLARSLGPPCQETHQSNWEPAEQESGCCYGECGEMHDLKVVVECPESTAAQRKSHFGCNTSENGAREQVDSDTASNLLMASIPRSLRPMSRSHLSAIVESSGFPPTPTIGGYASGSIAFASQPQPRSPAGALLNPAQTVSYHPTSLYLPHLPSLKAQKARESL